jgi:amylosucrase
VLFIAEAIVAPVEITKYFGEDAVIAKECEIAYNATFMALLWDAMATRNARLLNQGISSLPDKLERATWLNYVRCHDDIGLGFDDADISAVGYDPAAHRSFIIDYFTGSWDDSPARGRPFGQNKRTGDARISGSLASLVGLEDALAKGNEFEIQRSIDQILLLHSMIISFGGIPLIYYGDELGTVNNYDYTADPRKAHDNRWLHRPLYDWNRTDLRAQRGTVEQRLFDGIKNLIATRKAISAMADFNNREHIDVDNPHLFVFIRTDSATPLESVLVVANFNVLPERLNLLDLRNRERFALAELRDAVTGLSPEQHGDHVVIPANGFCWLMCAR